MAHILQARIINLQGEALCFAAITKLLISPYLVLVLIKNSCFGLICLMLLYRSLKDESAITAQLSRFLKDMKVLLADKVYVVNVLGTWLIWIYKFEIVKILLLIFFTSDFAFRLHSLQFCHRGILILGSKGWV